MPKMNTSFDPNEHEPQDDFSPVPPGEYTLEVSDSSIETSGEGNEYLEVVFVVIGPEGAGKRVWERFNLWHETSQQAREIAHGEFSSLCRSCGVFHEIDNSDVLHGKTCKAKLKVETYTKNDGGEGKKNVVSYFKHGDEGESQPWQSGGGSGESSSSESSSSESESGGSSDSGGAGSKAPWQQ